MNKISRVLITPMRPRWANDQDAAHLQTKTVPKNLIWSESAQWLQSSSVCKIPGALIMPMGTPNMPPRQITMMMHIYRPRQFQLTWFWVNGPCECWVRASKRFQKPLSCPWACPLCTHGQMTKTLHMYRPRRFQWSRFWVNRPCSCGVPASARFQKPLSCPWACPLCPHGQITMTLHIYRLRGFQTTWFGVNRPSGCWVLA